MVNLEHKMLQTSISREKALKPQKQGVAYAGDRIFQNATYRHCPTVIQKALREMVKTAKDESDAVVHVVKALSLTGGFGILRSCFQNCLKRASGIVSITPVSNTNSGYGEDFLTTQEYRVF